MFLSHIIQKKNLKDYVQKLNSKIFFLKQVQEKHKLSNLHVLLLKNQKYSSKYFYQNIKCIKYIITISAFKSNSFVYLSDVKGRLKFLVSAGTANLTGKRQKSLLELTLTKTLIILTAETSLLNNEPVLIYIKNIPMTKSKLSIKYTIGRILEKRFKITHLINGSLSPHNGCRPKKIKRGKKKSKKIRFLH